MDINKLIKLAMAAREYAYTPYSRFNVGASLLMEDGAGYTGCNIENAAYGATNCAERTAIFKAVSEGHKKIKALCVIGPDGRYTWPCGICRQVIAEFADTDTKIIIARDENEYIIKTLEDILPGAFTKKDL